MHSEFELLLWFIVPVFIISTLILLFVKENNEE